MSRATRAALALAGAVALTAAPGAVAAHGGHGHDVGTGALFPAVLFVLGVGLLAGSAYADHRGIVDRTPADIGVALGVLAAAAGGVWLWL